MSFTRKAFDQREQKATLKPPQAKSPVCARAQEALENWRNTQSERFIEEEGDKERVDELIIRVKMIPVQVTRIVETQHSYILRMKPVDVNEDSEAKKHKTAIFNARREVLKLRRQLESSEACFQRCYAANKRTEMLANLESILDQLHVADNELDSFQSQIHALQRCGEPERCQVTKPEVESFVKTITTRGTPDKIHRKSPPSLKRSQRATDSPQQTREITKADRSGVRVEILEAEKKTKELRQISSLKETPTRNDRIDKKGSTRLLFSDLKEKDGIDKSFHSPAKVKPTERDSNDRCSIQANSREVFLKDQQPTEAFLRRLFESSRTILGDWDVDGIGTVKGECVEDHLMSQQEFLSFVHYLHILDIRIKHSTVNAIFEKMLHDSMRSRKKFTKRIEFLHFKNALEELAVMKYPHADEPDRFAKLYNQFLIPFHDRMENGQLRDSSLNFMVVKRLFEPDVVQFLGEQHLALIKLFTHFGTAHVDCQMDPNDEIHYDGDILMNKSEWVRLWDELQPNEDLQQLQKVFDSVAGRSGGLMRFSQFLECLGIVAMSNGANMTCDKNLPPLLPQLQFLFLELDREGSIFNMKYIAGRRSSQLTPRGKCLSPNRTTPVKTTKLHPNAPLPTHGKTAKFVIDLFMTKNY